MAKQESIIPLRGSIGNLNFYKKNGEYLARRKGSVDKKRILTDPKFARTRENMAQFELVANDQKLFKGAIAAITNKVGSKIRTTALSSLFFKIASLDRLSGRGKKQVAIGIKEEEGINLFRGLALTNHAVTHNLSVQLRVDRTRGIISSDAFIPETQLFYPPSATHFEMQSAVVAIDFETRTYAVNYSEALLLPIDQTPLTLALEPDAMPNPGGDPSFFVMLSLTYYKQDSGNLYQLKSSNCLSLDVIDAFNS